MSRPERCRKVETPPKMKGFKPFGIHCKDVETIVLSYEEYESIRMVNYEDILQIEASKTMGISRPTFTRIHNRALSKIAKSLIEGKTLLIDGGNYQMPTDWYKCKKCHRLIQGLENHTKCKDCTDYNNSELVLLNKKTEKL